MKQFYDIYKPFIIMIAIAIGVISFTTSVTYKAKDVLKYYDKDEGVVCYIIPYHSIYCTESVELARQYDKEHPTE